MIQFLRELWHVLRGYERKHCACPLGADCQGHRPPAPTTAEVRDYWQRKWTREGARYRIGRAYSPDDETWAAWLHFAPTNLEGWPPFIVSRALERGGLFAAHVILHELYGCGFVRDARGRSEFFGP